MSAYEIIISLISVIANIATAIAVYIAYKEMCVSNQQYRDDHKHDQRKDTLDAFNHLQEEVFDPLYRDYTKESIEEIIRRHHEPGMSEEYRKLGVYLARIEHFCVGVEHQVYDWELVYELAHGFFDDSLRKMLQQLVDKKNTNPENRKYITALPRVWDRMLARSEEKNGSK